MERNFVLNTVFPSNNATITATQNGNWTNSSTWGGSTPSASAKVYIPNGITVTYNANSNTSYDWVRVDGVLDFQTNADTKLVLDTLVIGASSYTDGTPSWLGHLIVGEIGDPIDANRTAIIEIDAGSGSGTTINRSGDIRNVSRGIIGPGQVTMHGAVKTPWLEGPVNTSYPAGSTSISLASSPSNWEVGDEIIIAGTDSDYSQSNFSKDDVRTINSGYSGGSSIPVDALTYAHSFPSGHGLRNYVGNFTRNVILRTKNGSNIDFHKRGHMMVMHNNAADIRYVAIQHFGRTDKQRLITDPGNGLSDSHENSRTDTVNGLPIAPAWDSKSNPRGRYALHFHRHGGREMPLSDAAFPPITVIGCAVQHSPGWGIVVHESKGRVEDNVSFNVTGAHYVTEEQLELAYFNRNLAIRSEGTENHSQLLTGTGWTAKDRRRDNGARGMGFWLDSPFSVRELNENVVSGTYGPAYIIYGHDDTQDNFGVMHGQYKVLVSNVPDVNAGPNSPTTVRNLFTGMSEAEVFQVPVGQANNNVGFNAKNLVDLRGNLRDDTGLGQGYPTFYVPHQDREYFQGWKGYNLWDHGVFIGYGGQAHLEDWLLLGDINNPLPAAPVFHTQAQEGKGVDNQKNVHFMIFENMHIEGFEYGIQQNQTGNQGLRDFEEHRGSASKLIGGYFSNVSEAFHAPHGRMTNSPFTRVPEHGPFTPYYEISGNPNFAEASGNSGLTASFVANTIGGNSIEFDGTASKDDNYPLDEGLSGAPKPGSDIWPEGEASTSNQGDDTWDNNYWAKYGRTVVAWAWDIGNDGSVEGYGRDYIHNFSSNGTTNVKLTVWDWSGNSDSVVLAVNHTAVAYPNIVRNSNFNTAPNNSNAPHFEWWDMRGWNAKIAGNGNHLWKHNSSGGYMFVNGSFGNPDTLTQFIEDSRVLRGDQSFNFDYMNGGGKTLKVRLWGVNAPSTGGFFLMDVYDKNDNEDPYSLSNMPGITFTKVFEQTYGSVQSNWTASNNTVNLGSGYDYYIIDVWSEPASTGDNVRVDDFVLGLGTGGGTTDTSPTITTNSLPGGVEGTAYSQALNANSGDGTLTWSISSGSLPAGLSLSNNGTISGTPSSAGTANFTVRVGDADDDFDTQALSIAVSASNNGGSDYSDDFSDNSISDWSSTGGTWNSSGGEVSHTTNTGGYPILTYNNGSSWSDYTYTFDMTSAGTDNDLLGGVFYYSDANNHLGVFMTNDTDGGPRWALFSMVGGTRTILDQVTGTGYTDNTTYTVTVSVQTGGSISVSSGSVSLSGATPASLTGGTVGFITQWSNDAVFDNVIVTGGSGDNGGNGGALDATVEIDPWIQYDGFIFRVQNDSASATITEIQFTVNGGVFDAFGTNADFGIAEAATIGNASDGGSSSAVATLNFTGSGLAAGSGTAVGSSGNYDLGDIDGNFSSIDASITFSDGTTLSGTLTNVGDSDDGDSRMYQLNLTAAGTDSGSGPDPVGPEFEAEFYDTATSSLGPWAEVSDSSASNGAYMAVPENSNNNSYSTPPASGYLDYEFTLVDAGQVYIWVRGQVTSSGGGGSDSIHIDVLNDGSGSYAWNNFAPSSERDTWVWKEWTNSAPGSLSAGTHTLRIWYREDGFRLDQVAISQDPNYNPDN